MYLFEYFFNLCYTDFTRISCEKNNYGQGCKAVYFLPAIQEINMKEFTNFYKYDPTFQEFDFFTEDALLFDIETTGLSKKNHQIYLIGCAHRKGNEICVHQFFAENEDDQMQMLQSFLALSQNFSKLVTFNGKRFDEPFLIEKCCQYHLDKEQLPPVHLDIYLECKKIKPLLSLNSYKQKSVETFLGIDRDDTYDGGQLISVYREYISTKNSELLDLLLLHNYEDVVGMVKILPILSYQKLLSIPPKMISLTLEEYRDMAGEVQQELAFTAALPATLPTPIRLHRPQCHLILQGNTLRGTIPFYRGILKHYLPNCKDYVYLPGEDIIVLKSMASCIPSEAKEKATPANCCIKKEGLFLPLPVTLSLTEDVYLFTQNYNDKETYILYDPDTVTASFMEQYLCCFLNELT